MAIRNNLRIMYFFFQNPFRYGIVVFFICLTITTSCPATGTGKVVALMDGRQWPYEQALAGIKITCECSPEIIYLNESTSSKNFQKLVDSLHPPLFIAVGSQSLKFIRSFHFRKPIVYSMVLNPWSILNKAPANVVGVTMNIAPQAYWDAMDHLKPRIKTIGLVYNPATSSPLIERMKILARQHGQKLLARPVDNPAKALQAINKMAPQINAFLMLPDTTILRREIIDSLISSSLVNNFVLIGLSSKYVKAGALMAYSFNSQAIGRSAGLMVNVLLNSSSSIDSMPQWAPQIELSINLKTARKIGIGINQDLLKKAKIIIK